ncbi:TerD family protein [Romboutsia sp. Marseille-P6047]|uniref:TerD family protein n=1 Tax=Romboutsia sp. Marseille-P6047 TaxID=2161817 RepID=UPI000F06CBBF|nr:TerD family protein [Romboutsia sp. Marseille-P6047]
MNLLNLQKNDILDLTKKDPSLNNIVLAAGWDVVKRGFFNFGAPDMDLDLSAILLGEDGRIIGEEGIIYFRNQRGPGIFLHNDNRTGEGHGDDEKISITLNSLPSNCKKVIFSVNIYQGKERRQDFSKVRNAYVRVLNSDKGDSEICRYNLSEDGGKATSLIFAELEKIGSDWNFKAVGQLLEGNLTTLIQKYQ